MVPNHTVVFYFPLEVLQEHETRRIRHILWGQSLFFSA